MGIRRGTVLALTGIGGALVERELGLIGQAIAELLGGVTLPPEVSWGLGCAVGVVAGDLFTALTGQEVNTGKWVGIWKGLIAAVAGVGSLFFSDGNILWFVGSIWATTVAGDLLGL